MPTFERHDSLVRLLDAIARQTHPIDDLEVIVVDDGSRDGTWAMLSSSSYPYQLRALQQEHGGAGAARNRGVAAASGDVVLFLDDDVIPDEDLVASHLVAQRRSPDTVTIGPMLPPVGWSRPAWIRWEEDKLVQQYRAMLKGVYECTPRQFFTANAALPRQRFIEAGGFDPSFVRAEDVELGFRLHAGGMQFAFEPRAAVVHYPRRSFGSWRRTPYQYGRGDVTMHRDKGHGTLDNAFREFHGRHRLNRLLTRACVGHAVPFRATAFALGVTAQVADHVGLDRVAGAALSALFGLLYWQGVTDEIGDRDAVWRAVAAAHA